MSSVKAVSAVCLGCYAVELIPKSRALYEKGEFFCMCYDCVSLSNMVPGRNNALRLAKQARSRMTTEIFKTVCKIAKG